jgi:hypothetical protein
VLTTANAVGTNSLMYRAEVEIINFGHSSND